MLGSEPTVKNLQFADDLAINTKLRNYFQLPKPDVSPIMSKVKVFEKRNIDLSGFELCYDSQKMPLVASAKLLVVIFQQNLTLKEFVDCLIESALRATNILKSLFGTQWALIPIGNNL